MIELAVARMDTPAVSSAFAVDPVTAVTAFHCLQDPADERVIAGETTLRFIGGTERRARYVSGDPEKDWAILRLDERLPDSLQPIPLRTEIAEFEMCRCLGFPASALQPGELGFQPVLGMVSGRVDREGGPKISLTSFEVGAKLDPRGLSGGPLVPRGGPEEAVGVMSRVMIDPHGRPVGGVVYACPADVFAAEPRLTITAGPGRAPPPDAEDALSNAARSGDVSAAAMLGRALRESGRGAEAEPWLREAANAGSATAAFELGMLLDPSGSVYREAPERADEALIWFRKAATSGDAMAAATLGVRLHQRTRNEAAKPWLESAAERGDAMAAHTLGIVAAEDSDEVAAHAWHVFAAEHGDTRSARMLGQLLAGRGENDAARYWLEQAGGDPDAEALLERL